VEELGWPHGEEGPRAPSFLGSPGGAGGRGFSVDGEEWPAHRSREYNDIQGQFEEFRRSMVEEA